MKRSRNKFTRQLDIYDDPPVWTIDCKEVRQAIASGVELEKYQRALYLYVRTRNLAYLRGLKGVKIFEENAAAIKRLGG